MTFTRWLDLNVVYGADERVVDKSLHENLQTTCSNSSCTEYQTSACVT